LENLDQLREYSEPGRLIGRGQFLDATVDPVSLSPGQFVSDDDIVRQVNAMIFFGQLRRPDPNRLYVVYTPPDVHVRLPDGQDSIHDFFGYHSSFRDTFNETVNYAVVVHQAGNASLGGWGYDAFQQFTEVTSHELAEAVTDPDVRTGWFDSALGSRGEIGDLANLDIATLNGYTVQKEWSNQQFAATGNGHFLLQIPNVQSFSMLGNGIIYELDTGGVLWHRDPIGNWNAFDTGVQSFGLGYNGTRVCDLRANGSLNYTDGSGWNTFDTGVQSFALANDGRRVYDLRNNGTLSYTDGSGWQAFDTGVQSFALGDWDGIQYVIDLNASGVLKASTGDGWHTQDTGVTSFALGDWDGFRYLIDLHFNGDLRASTGDGWHTQDTGVTSFALGDWDGFRYVVDLNLNGDLRASTGDGWHTLDTGVQSFVLGLGFSTGAASSTLYVLEADGTLRQYDGSWTTLDSNVQSFSLGPDFSSGMPRSALCVLEGTGDLRQYNGSWTTLDTGVQAFLVGAGGSTVDVLEADGNLVQYTGSGPTLLDQGVVEIWLDNGGYTLFALQDDGTVQQFPA
jgi:hypothetical protein